MLLISKIMLMNDSDVLNSLQKRNDSLKSKLFREQLKYGNYSFGYFEKYAKLLLNDYKQTGSLLKSSLNVGLGQLDALNWYVQGQMGNELFRQFSLEIDGINNIAVPKEKIVEEATREIFSETSSDGDYTISQYGDGWSYKTFNNGEKIFLISSDLDKLKDKVKSRHLPLD